VEAEGVRIKATAADIRDTILQGLLPAILNSVMQHELGDGLDYIRKWSKMAERYGNSEINNVKDISEIMSTINDFATRLERTQLRAVTPERKTVQFTTTKSTKSYSRDTSPVGPTRNFDPITGQRLNNAPMYDFTTGARLHDNTASKQRHDSMNDRHYRKKIDRRHQPPNTQNVIIHRKTITEIITEIHRLKETTIKAVPNGMEINNIIAEIITDHLPHNVMEVNNTKIEITSPDINLIIAKMKDKVTIVEAITGEDNHGMSINTKIHPMTIVYRVTGIRATIRMMHSRTTTETHHTGTRHHT